MFGKDIRVFLKDQAKEAYFELKKNPQFGDPIKKELIPVEFIKQGIKNIYRAELSNYWRMLYTIEGNKIEILVFVLKVMNHKEYNKLFGYK